VCTKQKVDIVHAVEAGNYINKTPQGPQGKCMVQVFMGKNFNLELNVMSQIKDF